MPLTFFNNKSHTGDTYKYRVIPGQFILTKDLNVYGTVLSVGIIPFKDMNTSRIKLELN